MSETSKVWECIGFFASSIKCGDNWSPKHQEVMEAARAELRGIPVAPEARAGDCDWLRAGSLLYRLTDERLPSNRDEINITMANGSRDDADREQRAIEIQAILADSQVNSTDWSAHDKAISDLAKIVARWDSEPFPAIGYDASQDRRVIKECLRLASELRLTTKATP